MGWFNHPRKKYLYAVTGGKYLGELLVYMEKKNENFNFLTLPDMKIREIPYDKFEFGLTNKIVDIVEKLPGNVYTTCKKQYLKSRLIH